MEHPKLDLVLFEIRELKEDVTLMRNVLTGNGSPSNGIIVRMDRAEQFIQSARKFIWILIGASLTPGAILAVVNYFVKGN